MGFPRSNQTNGGERIGRVLHELHWGKSKPLSGEQSLPTN